MKKLVFAFVAMFATTALFAQEPPTVSTAELSMRYCDAPVEVDANVKIDINTTYEWEGDIYSETGNYTKVLADSRGCDSIVTLHLKVRTNPTGSVDGLFSISSTQQVYFSKGNLHYSASNTTTGPWYFVANQWTNGRAFRYGTSGYNSYNPDNSAANNNYLKYTSLTQTSYDWGWYNAIKNGGEASSTWYTMSKDQFNYLINTRSASLKSFKTVHNQGGMILLPDAWSWGDVVVNDVPMTGWPAGSSIDDATWTAMEDNGAVFFKAGTYWTGTNNGQYKPYASGTMSTDGGWAFVIEVTNSACNITYPELRYTDARQVRLVRNKP